MIGFIGAGKVGITLGRYFTKEEITVTGYYSRSIESAEEGANLTGSKAYENMDELVASATYIMITTPDDSIIEVANRLAGYEVPWQEKVICHTSGVHPSTLLNPLQVLGATTCSLHPMLSFANRDSALNLLYKTPLTLEGQGILMDNFKRILQEAHLNVSEIETKQKVLYHATACMVSNFLVTLMDMGIDAMTHTGVESETAMKLIEPLATATLSNFFQYGSEGALTGPISRGDVGTIRSHLHALTKADREIEKIYRLLGNRTINIATRQNRLDEYTLDRLKEVLQDEEKNHGNNQKNEGA